MMVKMGPLIPSFMPSLPWRKWIGSRTPPGSWVDGTSFGYHVDICSKVLYCCGSAGHPLLVDGVLWCQGDLFSKELQIHSGRPDQQVAKTTLMPPSKILVYRCQISGMPTTEQVPPDTEVVAKLQCITKGRSRCILASLTPEYHPPH